MGDDIVQLTRAIRMRSSATRCRASFSRVRSAISARACTASR